MLQDVDVVHLSEEKGTLGKTGALRTISRLKKLKIKHFFLFFSPPLAFMAPP